MTKEELRSQIEKIVWKHYDPERSMNGEEAAGELLALFQQHALSIVSQSVPDEVDLAESVERQFHEGFNFCRYQTLERARRLVEGGDTSNQT